MDYFIESIRHFGIVVSNMSKSLYFYQDLLGLKVVSKMNCFGNYVDTMLKLKHAKIDIVKLATNTNSVEIELLEYRYPPKSSSHRKINFIGPSHTAFTVTNLDNFYQFLISKNVKFNSPPQISSDRKVKVCFCYDPDDTPIELVEML